MQWGPRGHNNGTQLQVKVKSNTIKIVILCMVNNETLTKKSLNYSLSDLFRAPSLVVTQ